MFEQKMPAFLCHYQHYFVCYLCLQTLMITRFLVKVKNRECMEPYCEHNFFLYSTFFTSMCGHRHSGQVLLDLLTKTSSSF